MSTDEIIGTTVLVLCALAVVVLISVSVGRATAPIPTHFTDCRHVLDFVNGHWQHVWKCR